jgi:hypothetical protein
MSTCEYPCTDTRIWGIGHFVKGTKVPKIVLDKDYQRAYSEDGGEECLRLRKYTRAF